jgi:hypothetical protein
LKTCKKCNYEHDKKNKTEHPVDKIDISKQETLTIDTTRIREKNNSGIVISELTAERLMRRSELYENGKKFNNRILYREPFHVVINRLMCDSKNKGDIKYQSYKKSHKKRAKYATVFISIPYKLLITLNEIRKPKKITHDELIWRLIEDDWQTSNK